MTMRRIESGTLRRWSHSARAEECENNTGARDTRMASTIVASETWARSTSIPTRFISRTTSSPNGVRPLCFALSVAASAQSIVSQCVSVM